MVLGVLVAGSLGVGYPGGVTNRQTTTLTVGANPSCGHPVPSNPQLGAVMLIPPNGTGFVCVTYGPTSYVQQYQQDFWGGGSLYLLSGEGMSSNAPVWKVDITPYSATVTQGYETVEYQIATSVNSTGAYSWWGPRHVSRLPVSGRFQRYRRGVRTDTILWRVLQVRSRLSFPTRWTLRDWSGQRFVLTGSNTGGVGDSPREGRSSLESCGARAAALALAPVAYSAKEFTFCSLLNGRHPVVLVTYESPSCAFLGFGAGRRLRQLYHGSGEGDIQTQWDTTSGALLFRQLGRRSSEP